jgi:hypothetical protein
VIVFIAVPFGGSELIEVPVSQMRRVSVPTALLMPPNVAFNNEGRRLLRLAADLYAKRSEGPVSAPCVEMCMAQHLSLSARGVE